MYALIRNELIPRVCCSKHFCGDNWISRAVGILQKHSWIGDQYVSFSPAGGIPGSGAGKGGGAGGAVRESGGGLGKYGAAQEEHYFFNKQKEQLEKIKNKLKSGKTGELTQKEEK